MKSDTRERIIVVMNALKTPVSMNELLDTVEEVTGTRPDRKCIYKDLYAIERFYPLNVERRATTLYSLVEGLKNV